MIDLSIIIISFNTKNITKKCLETVVASLQESDFTTEIIVVDNASSDGSVAMLKKFQNAKIKNQNYSLKFKIIENNENLGFSKANNQAAKQARGQYLLFLNSDIEVIGDAIPKLYHFLTTEQKRFHFIGGKLFEKDGKTAQPSCGPFYSLSVVFAALFLRGDYWGLTRYSPGSIKAVDWVSGACLMTGKKNYEQLGGFDEQIFMYMEEIDLLYRAKEKHFQVGFFPDARFIHIGSGSSQNRTRPILQVYQGFLYFYKKHHRGYKLTILKIMLKLKALLAWATGVVTNNKYLKETYAAAYQITQMDR